MLRNVSKTLSGLTAGFRTDEEGLGRAAAKAQEAALHAAAFTRRAQGALKQAGDAMGDLNRMATTAAAAAQATVAAVGTTTKKDISHTERAVGSVGSSVSGRVRSDAASLGSDVNEGAASAVHQADDAAGAAAHGAAKRFTLGGTRRRRGGMRGCRKDKPRRKGKGKSRRKR